MPVLIEHYATILIVGIGQLPTVIDATGIPNLQTREKRNRKSVTESIIWPELRIQQMLIQKVIRNHKRPALVHLSRRAIEKTSRTIRKLSLCGQTDEYQNRYEGYAFDATKLTLFR